MKKIILTFGLLVGALYAENKDSNSTNAITQMSLFGLSINSAVSRDSYDKQYLTNYTNGPVVELNIETIATYLQVSVLTPLGTFETTVVDKTQSTNEDATYQEISYSPLGALVASAKYAKPLLPLVGLLAPVYHEYTIEDNVNYVHTKFMGLMWGLIGQEENDYSVKNLNTTYVPNATTIDISEEKQGVFTSRMFDAVAKVMVAMSVSSAKPVGIINGENYSITPYPAYDIYTISTTYTYKNNTGIVYEEEGDGDGMLYGLGCNLFMSNIFHTTKHKIDLFSTAYFLTGTEEITMKTGTNKDETLTNDITKTKFLVSLSYRF